MTEIIAENFDNPSSLLNWEVLAGDANNISFSNSELILGNNTTEERDAIFLVYKNYIPYDENALYTLKCKLRGFSATDKCGVGYIGYKNDYTLANPTVLDDMLEFYAHCMDSVNNLGTTSVEKVGVTFGKINYVSTANLYPATFLNCPRAMREEVAFIRPVIAANMQRQVNSSVLFSGKVLIDYLILEEEKASATSTGTNVITLTPSADPFNYNWGEQNNLNIVVNITNCTDGNLLWELVPSGISSGLGKEELFSPQALALKNTVKIQNGVGVIPLTIMEEIVDPDMEFKIAFYFANFSTTPVIPNTIITLAATPQINFILSNKSFVTRGESLEVTVTASSSVNQTYTWQIVNGNVDVTDIQMSGTVTFNNTNTATFYIPTTGNNDPENTLSYFSFKLMSGATNIAYANRLVYLLNTPGTISLDFANVTNTSNTATRTVSEGDIFVCSVLSSKVDTTTPTLKFKLTGIDSSEFDYISTDVTGLNPIEIINNEGYFSSLKQAWFKLKDDNIEEFERVFNIILLDYSGSYYWRLPSPNPTLNIKVLASASGGYTIGGGSTPTSEIFGLNIYNGTGVRKLGLSNRAMLLVQEGSVSLNINATVDTTPVTTYTDVYINGIVDDGTWAVILSNQENSKFKQTWYKIFTGYVRFYLRKTRTTSAQSSTLYYSVSTL